MQRNDAEPSKSFGFFDRPYLLLALAILFWAGNNIVGRAVRAEVPPVGLAFWRWTLATVFLFPFAWRFLKKDLSLVRQHLPIMALLAFLGIGSFNTLLYSGLQYTVAINAFLLQTLMPAVVILMSWAFFKEKVSAGQLLGIAVAFVGAAFIIFRGSLETLLTFKLNPGDAIIFVGVVLYAAYTALLRLRPPMHPLSFVLATFMLGVPMILPFYVWETFSGRAMTLSAPTLFSLLYVAIFPSILSYIFYNRGVELVGANRAGLSAYLMPVFGTVLAVLLLSEAFKVYHALGIGLVFLGVVVATNKRGIPKRRQRDE